ncbi:MAG: hypothetical protein AB8H79_00830, partial [Myxococcota bacterium]
MRIFALLLSLASLSACGTLAPLDGDPNDDPSTGDPQIESECDEDLELFAEHVWEPVLSRRCTTCHTAGSGTAASETAFSLHPDDVALSMLAAIQVADRIVDKPTG